MVWLKQFLTPPLIIIAAMMMWIEEGLWNWLKKLTGWIARVAFIQRFEELLHELPPYAAMMVLLLPMVCLFPLKLLAIYWLACGYWLASLMLIATAKVLGTAIIARMYVVCRPKLMTIQWFRICHDWLIVIRNRLYAAVRCLPIYKIAREYLNQIKLIVHRARILFRGQRGIWTRWLAIRRWHSRRSKSSAGT